MWRRGVWRKGVWRRGVWRRGVWGRGVWGRGAWGVSQKMNSTDFNIYLFIIIIYIFFCLGGGKGEGECWITIFAKDSRHTGSVFGQLFRVLISGQSEFLAEMLAMYFCICHFKIVIKLI